MISRTVCVRRRWWTRISITSSSLERRYLPEESTHKLFVGFARLGRETRLSAETLVSDLLRQRRRGTTVYTF